jgi:nicotinamide mononucleotide adenylyltransferase
MKNKYSFMIGRYQTFHLGHKFLVDKLLQEKGLPVLIGIRDVEKDEKNPFTAEQVKYSIEDHLKEYILLNKVKVIIMPDIAGVYYGRDVGYEVAQLEVPKEIAEISATKLRKEMGL